MTKETKWKLTRIGEGLEMTKVIGQEIATRKLNWFERIIYWRSLLKLPKQIKNK